MSDYLPCYQQVEKTALKYNLYLQLVFKWCISGKERKKANLAKMLAVGKSN